MRDPHLEEKSSLIFSPTQSDHCSLSPESPHTAREPSLQAHRKTHTHKGEVNHTSRGTHTQEYPSLRVGTRGVAISNEGWGVMPTPRQAGTLYLAGDSTIPQRMLTCLPGTRCVRRNALARAQRFPSPRRLQLCKITHTHRWVTAGFRCRKVNNPCDEGRRAKTDTEP